MSLALTASSRLKPEIRLAQAVSEFEADLSSAQKQELREQHTRAQQSPPDAKDVMVLTAEIDRRIRFKRGVGRCIGPRLTNFLQAVQQFAALGDIVVGGSQNIIACSVWSVVRMMLLVCVFYKNSSFVNLFSRSYRPRPLSRRSQIFSWWSVALLHAIK